MMNIIEVAQLVLRAIDTKEVLGSGADSIQLLLDRKPEIEAAVNNALFVETGRPGDIACLIIARDNYLEALKNIVACCDANDGASLANATNDARALIKVGGVK